jgi:regulator of sirC expression with transglutaminase-like and TPR domain
VNDVDRATFRSEVRAAGADLSPVRAGLLFAREIAYPDLRPSDYFGQLEDVAAAARVALAPHATTETRGLALAEFLFHDHGLRGNQADYYDPRNSYLNEVLDRRLGIPISLSVIYLEIGKKLGLPVAGVGLPGHFVVAADAPAGPVYLDPFNGGVQLSLEDCVRLVRSASGYQGLFEARWLAPTPLGEIVARMLNNLRNFYVGVEDWRLAIAVMERLRELQPSVPSHLRDLGLLHYRSGTLRMAARLLDEYLSRAPDAQDFDAVRQSRDSLVEHLARVN